MKPTERSDFLWQHTIAPPLSEEDTVVRDTSHIIEAMRAFNDAERHLFTDKCVEEAAWAIYNGDEDNHVEAITNAYILLNNYRNALGELNELEDLQEVTIFEQIFEAITHLDALIYEVEKLDKKHNPFLFPVLSEVIFNLTVLNNSLRQMLGIS